MPTLEVTNFNIVCAVLGGFIALFGLVSYLIKERFYLSDAIVSLVAGIIFSPHATNFIKPLEYALGSQENLDEITLYFARLVLGVQLVIAGIQLPSRYLRLEWKSLSLLLGPGMTGMWVMTSLLVWAFVPNLNFVYALAVGACVTPTDPVLSNTIVKGKFADKNIPKELQKIIIAESGTNDGLGYPFLFLPLYLIKFTLEGGRGSGGNGGTAIAMWFYETWVYEIILGVLYGAVVGWLAKELLHWAEERRYVDRESFLVFAIALALWIIGTCGMIGSDDVLACFIAGNVFTWDDWFRQETLDDSLQPTIDLLLNVSVFAWFGAVCPWHMFVANNVIPIYRLIFLGILVFLLRRPPVILAMHTKIHQIEEWRQALFVGYFGPIGVSAIFYLYVSLRFLRDDVRVDGAERDDAVRLGEIMTVVIWFLVICSIIIHGLSIPIGKIGFHMPRVLSHALSLDRRSDEDASGARSEEEVSPRSGNTAISLPMHMRRFGRSVIRRGRRSEPQSQQASNQNSRRPSADGNEREKSNEPSKQDSNSSDSHTAEKAGETERHNKHGDHEQGDGNSQEKHHGSDSQPEDMDEKSRDIAKQEREEDQGHFVQGVRMDHDAAARRHRKDPNKLDVEENPSGTATPNSQTGRSIRFDDDHKG